MRILSTLTEPTSPSLKNLHKTYLALRDLVRAMYKDPRGSMTANEALDNFVSVYAKELSVHGFKFRGRVRHIEPQRIRALVYLNDGTEVKIAFEFRMYGGNLETLVLGKNTSGDKISGRFKTHDTLFRGLISFLEDMDEHGFRYSKFRPLGNERKDPPAKTPEPTESSDS